MNYISWNTFSEAFGQLRNATTSFLSTQGATRTNSLLHAAAMALGYVGIGYFVAPRIAQWFYSLAKPPVQMKPNEIVMPPIPSDSPEMENNFEPEEQMLPNERRLMQGILVPPTPSDSPEMHKNYQIGIKLLKYGRKAILFSPNYLYRSEKYRSKCNDPESAKALKRAIGNVFLKVHAHLDKAVNDGEVEDALKLSFKEIEIFAKYAVKYNVANCHGICCACLVYARDKGIDQKIEMMQIDNHVFLVIGRNPRNSLPFSIERWERDAIVCDPWAQSCFPASEARKYLVDLSRVIVHPRTHEQYTIVKPFDSLPILIGELDLANPSYNESSRPQLPSPFTSDHTPSQDLSETDEEDQKGL